MSRNACGFRSETIAAECETDAALNEWGGSGLLGEFPPDDHYFWSAWRAEEALRTEDFTWQAKNSKVSSSSSATSTGSASS